ncbi:MAG: hypothetical protein E3K37_05310 [Candidatus Kuenenia sp.]|nr:hypothetical protein [Candidatus Kuenenia hertensis]
MVTAKQVSNSNDAKKSEDDKVGNNLSEGKKTRMIIPHVRKIETALFGSRKGSSGVNGKKNNGMITKTLIRRE